MKAKEYRDQSIEELQAQVEAINKELFELRTKLSVEKKLEKPHLLKAKKKDRARILTVLNEKRVA